MVVELVLAMMAVHVVHWRLGGGGEGDVRWGRWRRMWDGGGEGRRERE